VNAIAVSREGRGAWRSLALLVGLALLAKVPTLGTPAFWDEMAFLTQAQWLADNGLVRALPGLRPDALFFGHPPGLHIAGAAMLTLFGRSIEVAHVLIALIAAVGVGATWVMVRIAHDEGTAWLAALLLLVSPPWFSSAGMFLADLPVAALGVLCAVFAMRSQLVAFIVTASCMVLVKETAVSIVVALSAFRLLTRGPVTRATLRETVPWLSPLLAFVTFIVVQKAAAGKFFYIYDFETAPLLDLSLATAARQAAEIGYWLFIAQFRWIVTLIIVADLAWHRESRRRPELLLLVLVTVASGFAFSVLYFMERYVLPVLPFFYSLGAISMMALARTALRQRLAGVAALALAMWSLRTDPFRGHGEDNLHYVAITGVQREAAIEVEARYAGARIVSAWPAATQLSHPLLGYVAAPRPLQWFAGPADLDSADIAVVAIPGNPGADSLSALVQRQGWRAASARQSGPHTITIYERPPATARSGVRE
jgi:hypothetical protein